MYALFICPCQLLLAQGETLSDKHPVTKSHLMSSSACRNCQERPGGGGLLICSQSAACSSLTLLQPSAYYTQSSLAIIMYHGLSCASADLFVQGFFLGALLFDITTFGCAAQQSSEAV